MGDEKENVDRERDVRQQAWLRLRGALKDVYAEHISAKNGKSLMKGWSAGRP